MDYPGGDTGIRFLSGGYTAFEVNSGEALTKQNILCAPWRGKTQRNQYRLCRRKKSAGEEDTCYGL